MRSVASAYSPLACRGGLVHFDSPLPFCTSSYRQGTQQSAIWSPSGICSGATFRATGFSGWSVRTLGIVSSAFACPSSRRGLPRGVPVFYRRLLRSAANRCSSAAGMIRLQPGVLNALTRPWSHSFRTCAAESGGSSREPNSCGPRKAAPVSFPCSRIANALVVTVAFGRPLCKTLHLTHYGAQI